MSSWFCEFHSKRLKLILFPSEHESRQSGSGQFPLCGPGLFSGRRKQVFHSLIRFTPVIFSIFHSGSNPNSLMEWESFNRIASGKANRRVPQDQSIKRKVFCYSSYEGSPFFKEGIRSQTSGKTKQLEPVIKGFQSGQRHWEFSSHFSFSLYSIESLRLVV